MCSWNSIRFVEFGSGRIQVEECGALVVRVWFLTLSCFFIV